MKHVIIGTAGHVDHGKTALIHALTGIDTDRLPEEKARGLTTDLGFAHLDFPDGTQAGIVDVPGHEKFIKQMLCGAAGMDLALLVVAADEGFRPQTAEHLDILSLLGLRQGAIVLTKTDLVTPAQAEETAQAVRARVRGTFLEGKPLVPVSARTGDGIPALKELLYRLSLAAPERDPLRPFRLPIDRVFTLDGFGTIVTGTLWEGSIDRDTAVELVPAGRVCRVRGLQVHGWDVERAQAGQRVAVNLADVEKAQVRRGDSLTAPGSLPASLMADVRILVLPSSRRSLRTGSQLHLHHGASARLARAVLLDREALAPGESGYAQLRMTEPLAAKAGDRFVLRFLSPAETIGGGVILDAAPPRHKRGDPAVLAALAVREHGSPAQRVLQALTERAAALPTSARLAAALSLPEADVERELDTLREQGSILEVLPGRYLSAAGLGRLADQCRRVLAQCHAAQPLRAGVPTAELRQKVLPDLDDAAFSALLRLLARRGILRRVGGDWALPDFQVRLTRRQAAIRQTLLSLYAGRGQTAPRLSELGPKFPLGDQAEWRRVLESLLHSGELVRLGPDTLCHAGEFDRYRRMAADWFSRHETLTLAQFRDLLGSSRDYALLVLEQWDRLGLTRREGNVRRPGSVPLTEATAGGQNFSFIWE